jgi:hypothetical protein
MDRAGKEKKRKHAEARAGLSTKEIDALDAREAADEALESEARSLHNALFPEEWDFYHDSISDARDRKRGINPMKDDYIKKTNDRRSELGFALFMDNASDLPSDTQGWVLNMLREGKSADLDKILHGRELVDNAEEESRLLRGKMTREELEQKIDSRLASDAFLRIGDQNSSAPSVLAYRLYGCWIEFEDEGYEGTDEELVFQLRRLSPGLSQQEYSTLLQEALDVWIEAYG